MTMFRFVFCCTFALPCICDYNRVVEQTVVRLLVFMHQSRMVVAHKVKLELMRMKKDCNDLNYSMISQHHQQQQLTLRCGEA